jgi:hypothetical protein
MPSLSDGTVGWRCRLGVFRTGEFLAKGLRASGTPKDRYGVFPFWVVRRAAYGRPLRVDDSLRQS